MKLLLMYVLQCGSLKSKEGGVIMGTVTVRLNEEEEKIYYKYAQFNNIVLSTLMKEALMEKIEN